MEDNQAAGLGSSLVKSINSETKKIVQKANLESEGWDVTKQKRCFSYLCAISIGTIAL